MRTFLRRFSPLLAAAAVASFAATARADVTLDFSPGVEKALGADAAQIEKHLTEEVNAALERIGKGKAEPTKTEAPDGDAAKELRDAARAMFGSGQTIRIMCREEAADDPELAPQYQQSDPAEKGGGAATKGDFDQSGKPKKKGTTVIVIECVRLIEFGWYGTFGLDDTMVGLLGHELVHASNRDQVHSDDLDKEQVYRRFDRFFTRVVGEVRESLSEPREEEARRKRREERKRKREREREPSE